MKGKAVTVFLVTILSVFATSAQSFVKDVPFWQEYHEGFKIAESGPANEVRSIAVGDGGEVIIATAGGVFKKVNGGWTRMLPRNEDGPAYCVKKDATGKIWIGTWKSLFTYDKGVVSKVEGATTPVSVLCTSREGIYAIGPNGVSLDKGDGFRRVDIKIPRSVRSAVSDGNGGLWLASDVGLYHVRKEREKCLTAANGLLSASVRSVAFDKAGHLWVAALGGVNVVSAEKVMRTISPVQGCPTIFTNIAACSPDSAIWIGTKTGIVRFHRDGTRSLRFSRRWLMDDHVNDICFDSNGNAWIATMNGVSAISKKQMDLARKAGFFYDVLMKRHIRKPWIAGQCRMKVPGDVSTCQPDDDDNDGEYTGNYLAMESFRYAATSDPVARENASRAFSFLKMLQEVTGSNGYFARTIVPADWPSEVHDGNQTYSPEQLSEELVKEPRFKPVEERWRKSSDGKWLWKGDASSDEMCGHMMGYFFYHELVADAVQKKVVAAHIASIVDHLIDNNFNMMDVDGSHTRWSVWSPDQLNRDEEWKPDRYQNSMEMLAFLKLAYHVTKNEKYQQHYLRLIRDEHYLDNMSKVKDQDPAWFIYFDVILQAYLYPILLTCEKDPALLSFYQRHMDEWMEKRKGDKNPLINFFYCYARKKNAGLKNSIDLLIDTPLDLVSWPIDHTKREDVSIVHSPVLDDLQVSELPPASIRATIRWDANPWAAVNGNPEIEREPVFWLLPYWMGRYLKMIR